MPEERFARIPPGLANILRMLGQMKQELRERLDIAAVDLPSALEAADDQGRRCLSRTDE
jgi:hypothetical protein